MTDSKMANPKDIAENYLRLWNEPDSAQRRVMLEETWAPDARYADPMMKGEGYDDIDTMIEGAREQFPGHVFMLRGEPDGHNDFARFSWTLAPQDGAPVADGTDVVRLDGDGRIAGVVGFLNGTA